MNLASIIILLIVLAMAIVAICILRTGKGKCSCESSAKKPTNGNKCTGCTVDCPFKQ